MSLSSGIEFAHIVEFFMKSHLRWFRHVWGIPVETLSEFIDVDRPRNTIDQTIMINSELSARSLNSIHNRALWCCLILDSCMS